MDKIFNNLLNYMKIGQQVGDKQLKWSINVSNKCKNCQKYLYKLLEFNKHKSM